MRTASSTFDALVIGGGPAGSVTALLLAKAGWSVAVLERSQFPRRKVCGEFLSATNWPLLESLGIADSLAALSGPEIREVALFADHAAVISQMPRPSVCGHDWGRALGREHLDTLLLEQAAARGATTCQPWSALQLSKEGDWFLCRAQSMLTLATRVLRSRVVVAAHGSWETGPLPSQETIRTSRRSDLLGFKAHFRRAKLKGSLMPLLAFPGGYGGMVTTDHERVSFSCCVRRECLERIRQTYRGPAGEAVLAHIRKSCGAASDVLANAQIDGPWLAAGVIRPGFRDTGRSGLYLVGNAAGEAHPIIAEGISMAMQSAWLLSEQLTAAGRAGLAESCLRTAATVYRQSWLKSFSPRIRASALYAFLAMHPWSTRVLLPCFRLVPDLLRCGATLAGKAGQPITHRAPVLAAGARSFDTCTD